MTETLLNSALGVLFVVLALVLTFLMFWAWRYPFDHRKLKSAAPTWMVRLHRVLGVAYVLIYVYLMWEMIPRLWDYQVELPARTVMHLTVGFVIGAVLVVKLAVVRFFRHLEAKLVPFLGTSLLIGTIVLTSLALPFSLREIYLSETMFDGQKMDAERVARVREQLPRAGIADPAVIRRLASPGSLEAGRRVLTNKCTQCHDLRTVLIRPRPPLAWRQTVARMAERSTVLNPITGDDELVVTAYLIAVSPTLQQTLKRRRTAQLESARAQQAIAEARETMTRDPERFDLDTARRTFEATCSQCHDPDQLDTAPPATFEEVIALVQRMVGNGLNASERELDQVIYYLTETYVPGGFQGASESGDESPSPGSETAGDKGAAASGVPVDGETLFQEKGCFACHGRQGREPTASYIPKLAGQNRAYLVRQLRDMKSGARANGSTGQMAGVLANVSDSQIVVLAEHLSALNWSAP